jgi:hypothetical protein
MSEKIASFLRQKAPLLLTVGIASSVEILLAIDGISFPWYQSIDAAIYSEFEALVQCVELNMKTWEEYERPPYAFIFNIGLLSLLFLPLINWATRRFGSPEQHAWRLMSGVVGMSLLTATLIPRGLALIMNVIGK